MQGIPDKLNDFKLYEGGSNLIGIVDVDLPKFEAKGESIQGAGIAGEIESANIGHFGPMTLKITWRTLTERAATLAISQEKTLDFRGALQVWDDLKGCYDFKALRVTVRGIPKGLEPGKIDKGKSMGTVTNLEIIYIKILMDEKEIIELDKFNRIYKVDGQDLLSKVRRITG